MPRRAIELGFDPKPKIVKGRNFVWEGKKQEGYGIWFAHTKLKQLDALSMRIAKQASKKLLGAREEILVSYAKKRSPSGKLSSINPIIQTLDRVIINSLKVSEEQKKQAITVLDKSNSLSTFLMQSMTRERVSKSEFVAIATTCLSYYQGLSERRRKELESTKFSFEKTSTHLEKLARSGAKEYLPEKELIIGLKTLSSAHLWDVLGEDAAYIYKHAYEQAKTSIFKF